MLVTLGPPRLDAASPEGGVVTSLGPGKPLALLAYLAFAPRRVAGRERLCDLLWGNRDPDEARAQLRQTLYLLRQHVGPNVLEASPEGIALCAKLTVDAQTFAAEVSAGRLECAERLYTGEFFAGFASPGAAEFEMWVELERARIRALYIHTAESLARRAFESARFSDVARLAHRLREADPYGELGWRLLLEALTSAGDSLGARAEADHFEQWLRSEERQPEPASAAALRSARQIARPSPSGHHETDLAGELVGREKEFAAIQQLWSDARVKGARRVHVVGESGLGKTRLLLDLSTRLRTQRARVVYRRASPGERYIPFAFCAGFAGALAELAGATGVPADVASTLLALNPSLSSRFKGAPDAATGDEALRRRALALLELVAAVADEAPVAILVDDLHWCDEASQQVLALVASRLTGEHALLVTAARARHALPAMPDDTVRIALEPLGVAPVLALVTSLGVLPPERWAQELPGRLTESTRGNPLFIMEALRLCLEKGVLRRSADGWSCPSPDLLEPTLQRGIVIRQRLRGLGEAERYLLLLVALAASPVPLDLVAEAAGLTRADVEAIASRLEAHGLMSVSGAYLSPAHDEIADAAVTDADAALTARAHAALGAAMITREHAQWRRRAVSHLAEAGDWAKLPRLVADLLRSSRVDAGALKQELASLLGPSGSPERVERLRGLLPLAVRHRHLVRKVAGAAVVLGMVGAAFVAWSTRPAPPVADAVLVIGKLEETGHAIVQRIELRGDDWDPARPLATADAGRTMRWEHFLSYVGSSARRPGEASWVTDIASPDSGGADLELRNSRGYRERLTRGPSDDKDSGFSPDGRLLVFSTSRWDSMGHTDLAIMELATKNVRRLTRRGAMDARGHWSRDGTRIAFTRRDSTAASLLVCWTTVDGAQERCPAPAGWHLHSLVGWLADSLVLVTTDSAGTEVVASLNVYSAAMAKTGIRGSAALSLDQTGRWLLRGTVVGGRNAEWSVGPVARFDRARTLPSPFAGSSAVSWWSETAPTDYLDRVEIERLAGPIPVGVPILRTVNGWTKAGARMTPLSVHWRSLDERVASIDSSGLLLARDTGTVVIEASAGGWRAARDTVRIAEARSVTLLDEVWSADYRQRWRLFGEPLPEIVSDAHAGPAFFTNGDRRFFSGAYLTRMLSPARGLAVDVDLSTPITRSQWQNTMVGIQSLADSGKLSTWDHRTGYFPVDDAGPDVFCLFAFPAGEGADAARWASPIGLIENAGGGAPRRLDTGAWYRVRLQLFPDGRCGIALNGHAVFVSAARPVPKRPVRLMLEGSSVGTRTLVGRVRAMAGVPADVDWRGLRRDGEVWRAGGRTK